MPDPAGPTDSTRSAGPAHWWNLNSHFCWALSLFLVGFGAKLGLILYHGLAFPYLDQWPGEAVESFLPYLTHQLSVATLFAPHNEHRILFTRLAELGLLAANGQWDSLLEMTCNVAFFCAGMAGFGWALARLFGRRSWPFVWILLAADLALPFAWENTIWAFQSQFYFLIIFSLATIGLLGLSEPFSGKWWLGLLAAGCAFFSMASGFLAAAVAGLLILLRVWNGREKWVRHVPTWVICAALVFAGWHFRVNVPGHEYSQPHSVRDFLVALGKELAWPWVIYPWYAPLNLVPLAIFAWRFFRTRSSQPCDLLVLGLAGWAGLQALAATYARGHGGGAPAFRYMEYLSFLGIANLLAIYLMLGNCPRGSWLARTGAAVWSIGFGAGLVYLTVQVVHRFLPEIATEQAACLASARAFLATDNPDAFYSVPVTNRPYPSSADYDVWLFRNSYLRSILPVCVREPLRLNPATTNDPAFVPGGWLLEQADAPTERSWGSYSAQKEAAQGSFESLPIQPGRLPYLVIPIAGDLGEPGLSLKLVELDSGRELPVKPPFVPRGTWVDAVVPAPPGPFKLVARDDSATGWFAFKEPIEMGRLSWWNLCFLSLWPYLVILGVGLFALNLVRFNRLHHKRPAPAP